MAMAAAGGDDKKQQHPFAFHVSGPRNLSSPNWTDLINSTWKDENYKRMVMACFIQGVYLLELDRQEKRTKENTKLAPKWWIPFKYKLVQTLIDERDGSIFGAVLEWDGFIFMRPSGAPRAVLALRGTLLKSMTIRRDLEDDLRFLAWETLKGSFRFTSALNALNLINNKYGSNNICIAGHSLGAGFALQVGKALAHQGMYVEAHLFNPPSVSLSTSLRNIGEKTVFACKRLTSMIPFKAIVGEQAGGVNNITSPSSSSVYSKKYWMPNLYVNNNDYICCYYNDHLKSTTIDDMENKVADAKLFLCSNGNQKFLKAHRLEQWWSDDLELQMTLQTSTLISKQLKSLYNQ